MGPKSRWWGGDRLCQTSPIPRSSDGDNNFEKYFVFERKIESTYNYFSVVKNLGDLSRKERKRRGEGGARIFSGEIKKFAVPFPHCPCV